jgi:DtxR family Mn-dependent transcriptional regulator
MEGSVWILLILLTAAAAAVVFFPRYGLLSRWRHYRSSVEREALEDALKYIFDQEQQGHYVHHDALRGALAFSAKRIYSLLEQMESQGLIKHQNNQIMLTENGEKLALQIVRAHRLLERYLADEARLPLNKVHTIAHRREHGMSSAQIEELDAALGHPLADPHGDPIPNAEGQFQPYEKGTNLNHWEEDQPGKIIHMEDEPPLAFAQLLAAGLKLGQTIRILEKNNQRIVLTDGENEFTLAPAVAANVFLQELSEKDQALRDAIPLTALKGTQPAEIVQLDERCQGFTRRRFLDLGLTPGTTIYAELENAFGDPRAYRVRGTLIALRKDQAEDIWVKPLPQA